VPFFAVSFFAGVFFGAAVCLCLAQRARCAAEMRSRAARLSLGRGLRVDSKGLELVWLLVEPLGRPLRRATGSASLRRALARSRSPNLLVQRRHNLVGGHPCRPQLPILSGN